jgi:pyruvate dehydrogenase E1 component alpha subunit
LECVTFRFKGHFAGDPQSYMPAEQLAAAESADPIPAYRQRLLDQGVLSDEELTTIEANASTRVEDALSEVLAAPTPDAAELDQDVFAEMKGVPA